jgi:hypothetical protein
MVSANGFCWSMSNHKENCVRNYSFKASNIILVEFNPIKHFVKFSVYGRNDKVILQTSPPYDKFAFCAVLNTAGDSVELINDIDDLFVNF